jgi:hypothetical protein
LQVFVLAEKKVTDKCYATMFGLQTKNPKAAFSKLVFSFTDKYLQCERERGGGGRGGVQGRRTLWIQWMRLGLGSSGCVPARICI